MCNPLAAAWSSLQRFGEFQVKGGVCYSAARQARPHYATSSQSFSVPPLVRFRPDGKSLPSAAREQTRGSLQMNIVQQTLEPIGWRVSLFVPTTLMHGLRSQRTPQSARIRMDAAEQPSRPYP